MQQSQSLSQFVLQYQGQAYPLDKPQVIIGSDQRCDIHIDGNPHVLPMHAQVISQAGQVFLQNMQRGAAIWVNGSPASRQALRDQDEIAVGDPNTKLTLLFNTNPVRVNPLDTNVSQAAQGTSGTPVVGMQNLTSGWQSTGGTQFVGMRDRSDERLGLSAAVPQPQGQRESLSSMESETTRYLCAAGHLDENFQDYVMRNVIYEERKALGESYGVNMLTVISWCKSGINRINIRDSILSGLLALIIFGYLLTITGRLGLFPGVIAIVGMLVVLLIVFAIERGIKSIWSKSHPGIITYFIFPALAAAFTLIAGSGTLMGLAVFVIWLTVFGELLVRYYGESIKRLRKSTFNPQIGPVALDDRLVNKLKENFVTGQRNVIAYSGYKPFAGAGNNEGGWSFIINTSQGAHNPADFTSSPTRLTPLPFTVSSLYDAVERDVRELGMNNVLEIEGKLYVRGQYLPEHPSFFNSTALRPVTSVDKQEIDQYKEHPTEDIRYYQCIRFNFWRGEVIFTACLRFIQRGKDLFTEVDYVMLPPMKPDYYWVDRRESTPFLTELWRLYVRTFDGPVQMLLGAPFRLLRGYFYTREQDKFALIASHDLSFDFGASTSLRQFASDDDYHLFFQELDARMYLKIVEKQILQTIARFLDAHNVDISELVQRQQTILNNNTTNNNTTTFTGQINNTGHMGLGSGAQVHNNAPHS